jgi:hypothetical protein
MPSPSRHVELGLYVDETAVIATSRQPALLAKYLETYLSDLEQCLSEWRIAINVAKSSAMLLVKAGSRITKPRSLHLFGEAIKWVDNTRYLGVTLDKRLTWSTHIYQVKKKAAQGMGALGPLLKRRSGISIGNDVLLYKQLILPTIDYACPVWRSAARSRIKKLQVLQSKCLRIATNAPWYIGNRKIHDDFGVPYFFSDHVRYLRDSIPN